MDQCTVAANKVDADCLGRGIQRFGVPDRVGIRCGAEQHRNRGYADALVHDGNPIICADAVDNRNKIARKAGNFAVDFLAGFAPVRVNAVQ